MYGSFFKKYLYPPLILPYVVDSVKITTGIFDTEYKEKDYLPSL